MYQIILQYNHQPYSNTYRNVVQVFVYIWHTHTPSAHVTIISRSFLNHRFLWSAIDPKTPDIVQRNGNLVRSMRLSFTMKSRARFWASLCWKADGPNACYPMQFGADRIYRLANDSSITLLS